MNGYSFAYSVSLRSALIEDPEQTKQEPRIITGTRSFGKGLAEVTHDSIQILDRLLGRQIHDLPASGHALANKLGGSL